MTENLKIIIIIKLLPYFMYTFVIYIKKYFHFILFYTFTLKKVYCTMFNNTHLLIFTLFVT